MKQQRDLFTQAKSLRDDSLVKVEEHAPEDWKTRAWTALVEHLRRNEEFFAPDFWRVSGLEKPREARALGALIMRAAKEGLIAKVGFRQSTDPRSHLCPRAVWRSTIYRRGSGETQPAEASA